MFTDPGAHLRKAAECLIALYSKSVMPSLVLFQPPMEVSNKEKSEIPQDDGSVVIANFRASSVTSPTQGAEPPHEMTPIHSPINSPDTDEHDIDLTTNNVQRNHDTATGHVDMNVSRISKQQTLQYHTNTGPRPGSIGLILAWNPMFAEFLLRFLV